MNSQRTGDPPRRAAKSGQYGIRMPGWVRIAGLLALGGALLLAVSAAQARPRNIKLGDPVGELRLTDLNGRPVDSSAWNGKPSIWVFVSPGQSSSEKVLAAVQAAVDATPAPGIAAVGLVGDADDLAALRDFAGRHRIRMPIALDVGRAHYGRLGVIVLPTTILVDKQGRVHETFSGHEPAFERNLGLHARFLAGRLNREQLDRDLAATQPARDATREQAERLTRSAAILCERGLWQEAISELTKAVAADPGYHRARLDLAVLKLGQDDAAGAEPLVRQVLTAEPNHREAHLVLGVVQLRLDRLDEAEELLKKAVLLNPNPALANYWLGRVYEARGSTTAAQSSYRAAAERGLPAAYAQVARMK